MQTFSQKMTYWFKVVSLGVVLGLGLQFAQAWTAPTQAPPLGNVGGPVTLGAGAQYKTGKLGVNSAIAPLNALEVGGGGNAMIGGNVIVGGSVGIGTTNPQGKLQISTNLDTNIRITSTGTGTDQDAEIDLQNRLSLWKISNDDNASGGLHIYKHDVDGSGNILGTTVEGMYISQSGNAGFGTISPAQKLEVNGKIKMTNQTAAGDAADIVATKGYVDGKVGGASINNCSPTTVTGYFTGATRSLLCGGAMHGQAILCSGNYASMGSFQCWNGAFTQLGSLWAAD